VIVMKKVSWPLFFCLYLVGWSGILTIIFISISSQRKSLLSYRDERVSLRPKEIVPVRGGACVIFEDGNVGCWGVDENCRLRWGEQNCGPIHGPEFSVVYRSNFPYRVRSIKDGGGDCLYLLYEPGYVGSSGAPWCFRSYGLLDYPIIDSTTDSDSLAKGIVGSGCVWQNSGDLWCPESEMPNPKLNQYECTGPTRTDIVYTPPCKVPLKVEGADVCMGGPNSCVLSTSGNVYCWNSSGYMKYLTENPQLPKVRYENMDKLKNISIGARATKLVCSANFKCVITEQHNVRCWGENGSGQLGYGHTRFLGGDGALVSVGDVPIGEPVVDVQAGNDHVCVLLDKGRVRCWGGNKYGQLGYGHTRNIGDDELPSSVGDVPLGGAVRQLTVGGSRNCAILENGQSRCWGSNEKGELGYLHNKPVSRTQTPAQMGDVPMFHMLTQPMTSKLQVELDHAAKYYRKLYEPIIPEDASVTKLVEKKNLSIGNENVTFCGYSR
jgi:hypothetical protein